VAETDDDVIAGRFLPLPFARAYLEPHTTRAYAELLLRRGLASGFIGYLTHETEVHFPDRGKSPAPGRVLVRPPPVDGVGFWRVAPFQDNVQPEIDWERSEAVRTDHACQMPDGTWQEHRIVRLRGVRVSEDDLKEILQAEQLLPPAQQPASEPAPQPATDAPLGITGTLNVTQAVNTVAAAGTVTVRPIPLKNWLRAAKREHSKLSDETAVEWAKRLVEKMEAAKAAGLVDWAWSQETMERRLRDKDEDNDEGYQVGN
jgi:hypothetical protein